MKNNIIELTIALQIFRNYNNGAGGSGGCGAECENRIYLKNGDGLYYGKKS